MTQQKNLFYLDPDLTAISTEVIAVRPHFFGAAIALRENIVRASGGGEPRDVGTIAGMKILHTEKQDGLTWTAHDTDADKFNIGETVKVMLNAAHRDNRRRLHTATHLLIRCAYNHFREFDVTTADIEDDASSAIVVAHANREVFSEDVLRIDQEMRSEVLKGRPIYAEKAKSVEHAERKYGGLFRVSDRHAFRGKIRIICIEGLDANPCSGLHHPTANIGPYKLVPEPSPNANAHTLAVRIRLSDTWMYWFGE
jgi:Ser-tRNA(Ala) deacylase AlaX